MTPPSPELRGHEVIGHVFAIAGGAAGRSSYDRLCELWRRCQCDLQIDGAVPGYLSKPPSQPPAGPDGTIAWAVGSAGSQLALYRLPAVYCLSVVQVSEPGETDPWAPMRDRWRRLVASTTDLAPLGAACVLQAVLVDPSAGVDPEPLAPVVRRQAGGSPGWADTGVTWTEPPLGPFLVWEQADGPESGDEWDRRTDRTVVVVAPAGRDKQVSAWTWTNGGRPAALTRYLATAALLRYELRVWRQDPPQQRASIDHDVDHVLGLVDDVATTSRALPINRLLSASVPVLRLQAARLTLLDAATHVRTLLLTVDGLGHTLADHVPPGVTGGLLADDAALAEWLRRQVDRDVGYLQSLLDRALGAAELGDQLVQRGLLRRQERINLGLTGVVGAVLMVLAAVQAFAYRVPIPERAQPALIAVLGATALLASSAVVRSAAPARRWSSVAVLTAAGLLGATAGWLAASFASGPGTLVGAAIGVVAGVLVGGLTTGVVPRRSRRGRSPDRGDRTT